MKEKLSIFGKVIENEDLSKYTTYKVGGITKYLLLPNSLDNLLKSINYLNNNNIKYFIIGNGSNLLISDGIYDGVVIKLSELNNFKINDNILNAEAGAYIPLLSSKLAKEGYSGFEWACNLPSTIGGAIYGNAEAYKVSISDNLIDITILKNSKLEVIKKENIKFGYRTSTFKEEKNLVILSARFKLEKKDSNEILNIIKERSKKRLESQPTNYPSAGSVFRNVDASFYEDKVKKYNLLVVNGVIPAGYLIEKAGLKGYSIGGAMISEKHANFIINYNNASFYDILSLMNLIKEKVKEKFDIDLISEQEIINL